MVGGGVVPAVGSGSVVSQVGGDGVVLCVYVEGLQWVSIVLLNTQTKIKYSMRIHMSRVNQPVGRWRAAVLACPAFVADARPVLASAAPVARARRGGIALRSAPT